MKHCWERKKQLQFLSSKFTTQKAGLNFKRLNKNLIFVTTLRLFFKKAFKLLLCLPQQIWLDLLQELRLRLLEIVSKLLEEFVPWQLLFQFLLKTIFVKVIEIFCNQNFWVSPHNFYTLRRYKRSGRQKFLVSSCCLFNSVF